MKAVAMIDRSLRPSGFALMVTLKLTAALRLPSADQG